MAKARLPEQTRQPAIRRSAGRPSIPPDRIVSAALQLVDKESANALSMRALAQHLDSGTATLYRHFANRAELVAHVVDLAFAEIELDTQELTSARWQDAFRMLARSVFDVLSRHRGVAQLLLEFVPTGPNIMAQRERSIAILLNHGFPPALAARAYATLARFVLGFALQPVDNETPGNGAQQSAMFHKLDKSAFPATSAVANSLPVAPEEEFSFGLELMINGLNQLFESTRVVQRPLSTLEEKDAYMT